MNPLMSAIGKPSPMMGGINHQMLQQVKQAMNVLRSLKNPQATIMQAAQNNPQLSAVMSMCQGRNPQDVFAEQCKQHGLDPEQTIQQIRQMLNG